ncbi:MAG: phage head closure protein [Alphaproteobacteria bacterium]
MKIRKSTSSKLRHRLLLQQENQTSDGAGGYTRSWDDVGYVWAEIRPLRGSERVFAEKLQAETSHALCIRYRDDITARHRFVFDARVFAIHSIRNLYESKEVMEVIVAEGTQG